MVQIPTFDTAIPVPQGAAPPRAEPQAFTQAGNALAQGGAQLANTFDGFQARYAEARRATDAANGITAGAKQLQDLQMNLSKLPDHQQAASQYEDGSNKIIDQVVSGVQDPLVAAHVKQQLSMEAISRRFATMHAAFGVEAATNRGDLETRMNNYAQDLATANPTLAAQKVDQIQADVKAQVAGGWLNPAEAPHMISGALRSAVIQRGEQDPFAAQKMMKDYQSYLMPTDQLRLSEFLEPKIKKAQFIGALNAITAGANYTGAPSAVSIDGSGVVGNAASPAAPSAGNPNATRPAYQAPDLDGWVTKARAASGGDPEMEQRLVAGVMARYQQWHSATAVQRAALGRTLADTQAALRDGRDATIPSAEIKALYPAEQATDILGQLKDAQSDGQVTAGVKFAAPSDLDAMRTKLSDGVGPVSDGASDVDVANYRARRGDLERFDKAVATRNTALLRDPASFAAQSPAVADAAAARDPQNPASFEAYDMAVRAEQTRLGVPEAKQTTLPVNEIHAVVAQLLTADPAKVDIGQQMTQLSTQYGAAWKNVFGDLVRVGKLPSDFQTVAIMDQPSQAPARTDLVRALQASAAKGGMAGLEKDLPQGSASLIDKQLDTALAPFRTTALIPGVNGNIAQYSGVRQAARTLAMFYALQGKDGTEAADAAVNGILGRYEFDGTMRVPTGTLRLARTVTQASVAGLKPEDLAPLPPSGNPQIDQQRLADTMRLVKSNAFWLPNERDDGLVAYVRPRDGSVIPVMTKQGRLEIKFDQMPQLEPKATMPATPIFEGGP